MNWLFQNFIADMYGPHFLLLYGSVIVATLIGVRWGIRSADATASLPPPPLRSNPDPYELAYLRGGENEVTRLAIFSLIQRGYLKVSETKKWWGRVERRLSQASGGPDWRHLSPGEQAVFRFFTLPHTAAEVFQTGPQAIGLTGLCSEYETKLQHEDMLYPPQALDTGRLIQILGAGIILCLGGYKLIAALIKGHSNVVFLLAMGIAALFGLALVGRIPRLSYLGRDYLKRLQQAFERMKPKTTNASSAMPDATMLLLVSLFGVGVLSDTSYAYYGQMFNQSSGAGGCGGSFGGGGCGGSSSGGCGGGGSSGCGGGGGCGGCGGG
jgi:uncharacterized protein (TIGR04222 family)